MRSDPFTPQEARTFKKLTSSNPSMKSSLEATQPAEKEGKTPNWLFAPKLEEPSRRTVAEKRYFSS